MTTGTHLFNILVGYGDGYPNSNLGRLLTFCLCIAGTMVVSLMTVALGQLTSLTIAEIRVFNELERRKVLEVRKRMASALLVDFIKSVRNINEAITNPKTSEHIESFFYNYKRTKFSYLLYSKVETQICSFVEAPEGEVLNYIDNTLNQISRIDSQNKIIDRQEGMNNSLFELKLRRLFMNQRNIQDRVLMLIENQKRFGEFSLKANKISLVKKT